MRPFLALALMVAMATSAHAMPVGLLPGPGPTPGAAVEEPDPGISRELARRRRARIADLTYTLRMKLGKGEGACAGSVSIAFRLIGDATGGPALPLVLDFAGQALESLRVNGAEAEDPRRRHDHILVDPSLLRDGKNVIEAAFRATVGRSGTALTSYRDALDGAEYLYTLLVPADAHTLFPCFDQPDLKGRLRLTLELPVDWRAISNGPLLAEYEDPAHGRRTVEFAPTRPISTYLMAFAAGPFERIAVGGTPPVPIYVRASRREDVEAEELAGLHRRAVDFMQGYFDFRYPFAKLEFVLLPGFPYRGMEHPGAIFYRESALVFDHQPADAELLKRQTVIFHEVAHQWFGNLTTMEWFDDLWLKEGFATFVAYRALAEVEPDLHPWLRFLQTVEPRAYAIDATRGTTPIHQELANLADAKSAYGAIVYNKAPAVLKQLEYLLGDEAFRAGVRMFLRRHAYGNATWHDLVRSFEEASHRDLSRWAQAWIETAGMPRVELAWQPGRHGTIGSMTLLQESVQGESTLWPLKLAVLLRTRGGDQILRDVETSERLTNLETIAGGRAPRLIFPNGDDHAYGVFRLDERSLRAVRDVLPGIDDPLSRMLLVAAHWEMVRDALVAPAKHLELLASLIEREEDALSAGILLSQVSRVCRDYLEGDERLAAASRFTDRLRARLAAPLPEPLALSYLEGLLSLPLDRAAQDELVALLEGRVRYHSVDLAGKRRWDIVASLLAQRHPRAVELYERMQAEDKSADADKYAYIVGAARADRETKERYFESYLAGDGPPEQWVEESLRWFNSRGQEAETGPFLFRALEQVEWVKAHRKIFFMPAWLDAFINGQHDQASIETVRAFLEGPPAPARDIRLKVLQSLDSLERSVRVRARWARG